MKFIKRIKANNFIKNEDRTYEDNPTRITFWVNSSWSKGNSKLEKELNDLKTRIQSNSQLNESEENDFLNKIGCLRNTFSLDSIAAAK